MSKTIIRNTMSTEQDFKYRGREVQIRAGKGNATLVIIDGKTADILYGHHSDPVGRAAQIIDYVDVDDWTDEQVKVHRARVDAFLRASSAQGGAMSTQYLEFNEGERVRNQFGDTLTVLFQRGCQVFVVEDTVAHYHPTKLYKIVEEII